MFLEADREEGAGGWSPGESRDLPGSRDPGRQFSVQQVFALPLLEGEESDPARGLTCRQDDCLASPHRHASVKLRLSEAGEEELLRAHHGVMFDVSTPSTGYELTTRTFNVRPLPAPASPLTWSGSQGTH